MNSRGLAVAQCDPRLRLWPATEPVEKEWLGMSEGLNRQTVERLFAALIDGDLETFHDQFDKTR
jgi:hypothetical protein